MFVSIVLISAMFLPPALCGAQCQSEDPSDGLTRRLCFDGSNPSGAQRQKMRANAWSMQPATQREKFQVFLEDARSPLTVGAIGFNASVMYATEAERLAGGKQTGIAALYGKAALQKESSSFLGKYMYSSLLKQDPRYYPSSSGSIAGRTLYATSRLFITRKDSGQRTLNTSYFLGLLTAKVIATAYRPYWARSNSITPKTFGSTIGSDMGMNLLHEFGPGIRQLLKRHSPKFLRRQ